MDIYLKGTFIIRYVYMYIFSDGAAKCNCLGVPAHITNLDFQISDKILQKGGSQVTDDV